MSSGTQARTIRPRASAVPQRTTSDERVLGRAQRPLNDDYEDEYDDEYSPRLPTSARRYDRYPAVRPPVVEPAAQRHRRRGFLYVLLVLLCIFVGVALAVIIPPAWSNWRDTTTYGYPRTYQVDAAVGHGDPHSPTSHFIAINNNGVLEVIEIPGGDPASYPPQLYKIATVTGPGADLIVLTVSFADMNGDGKLDLIASYSGTEMVLFNNGKTFVPKL